MRLPEIKKCKKIIKFLRSAIFLGKLRRAQGQGLPRFNGWDTYLLEVIIKLGGINNGWGKTGAKGSYTGNISATSHSPKDLCVTHTDRERDGGAGSLLENAPEQRGERKPDTQVGAGFRRRHIVA